MFHGGLIWFNRDFPQMYLCLPVAVNPGSPKLSYSSVIVHLDSNFPRLPVSQANGSCGYWLSQHSVAICVMSEASIMEVKLTVVCAAAVVSVLNILTRSSRSFTR